MYKEAYVSFETAKLLNEKGFNGEFHKHYWGYEQGKEFLTEGSFNPEYDYPAPTHQMAMKWLRERYKIHIAVDITHNYVFFPRVFVYHDEYADYDSKWAEPKEFENYNTYDECVETALQYCLTNLI